MGVKLLSKFLKVHCNNVINNVHLSKLRGKKICIDTSIYLYRFKSQDSLIEKFYLMCSIFKKYGIIPIFIFDGKPTNMKKNTIEQRQKDRDKAWLKYQKLKEEYGNSPNQKEKEKLVNIKRNFIKIKKEDIDTIKNLLTSYGIKYIDANGEADILCANLIKNRKVYAVMTEDMDMFVHGCHVVLRYLSLANHTCMFYNLQQILSTLRMSFKDFQILCILSGTDYNISENNIFYNYKLFLKYNETYNRFTDFKKWLENNRYIDNQEKIENILEIYKTNDELKNYPYILINYKKPNFKSLFDILKKERFIFV